MRERGEEREIFRAQVYAINKLMRAKEEANFKLFKQRREAQQVQAEQVCGG